MKMNNFKIIASFASVSNNNNIYNYWDKNLIDKVAASIYYVEDDIEFNYNDLYETCNKLSKINNVKIKKLIGN